MRVGIVSDLHHEREPARERRWINRFETDAVLGRLHAALVAFRAAEVDVVVLLGDLTHVGDAESLDDVLAACRAVVDGPLAVVDGNHDAAAADRGFADLLRRHGALAPADAEWHSGGATLSGVAVQPAGAKDWRVSRGLRGPARSGSKTVVASHFPLLSQEALLTRAGLPYAGDLVDRAEALAALADSAGPVVVLSGHIHARCSEARGRVLQLSVGALVEPPFDATIVEVGDGEVARTSRRLGPTAPVDPVFAGESERWRWTGEEWTLAAS